MSKRKILYLTYDGLTDSLGQSQILPYLFGLSKNESISITIISFEKTQLNNFDKDNVLNKLTKYQIDWIPLKYSKSPPIISTIWDIYKLNLATKRLIKNGLDLIHCRSYIASIIALKIKKKYSIPFLFDMRGFWADERVDGKIWDLNIFIYRRIYKFFKKKEKEFLQFSNHTISLTSNGKKEIESWNLSNQSPITIIPCCVDENLFNKKNIVDKRTELGISITDFVISYVGSIGTWYMLDEMLSFFKILSLKKENAKFLFITKESSSGIYLKSKEFGIKRENVIVTSSTRDMIPSYISVSNFSIFFILPVYSKKASSPTKMGEIMNLGIPIICNSSVGDVDEIMEKCMPELVIKYFTKSEYVRVVDLIINDYIANVDKIINTSKEYYSLEKGVKKYLDVYKNVLDF